jgi:hypothetical protein
MLPDSHSVDISRCTSPLLFPPKRPVATAHLLRNFAQGLRFDNTPVAIQTGLQP